MEYLFECALGPVQSFIASSRRTRDLWFGSNLLSELSKTAARTIRNKKGGLIFPAPEQNLDENSKINVANKIIACIDTSPSELGQEIYEAIMDQLRRIKVQVYAKIDKNWADDEKNKLYNRNVADKQIEDMIEFFWVAVELTPEKYHEARQELEALMGGRKNTRNYPPAIWAGNTPKSSIDGQLENVIQVHNIEQRPRPRMTETEKKLQANELYRRFHAGPAERLSGVDLLKRLGRFTDPDKNKVIDQKEIEDNFLSTSHIAASSYLERLRNLTKAQQEGARTIWKCYIQDVQTAGKELEYVPQGYSGHPILNNLDGALLFPQRLYEDSLAPQDYLKAQGSLKHFFDHINDVLQDNKYPSPYYAILVADGDNMGKFIDSLSETNNGSIEQHRNISQALDKFAGAVRGIVEGEHQGALIYAGGDDVVAFVPLHRMLKCARALTDKFKAIFQEFKAQTDVPASSKIAEKDTPALPTLSVGIAIVHHLAMLQDALNDAREAEKAAKAVKGKNALAIKVCKRGGEEYTVAGAWNTFDSETKTEHAQFDQGLENLIAYFYYDCFPKGASYELREMAGRLDLLIYRAPVNKPENEKTDKEKLREKQYQELRDVAWVETGRILKRKLHLPENRLARNRNVQKRAEAAEKICQALQQRIKRQSVSNNHEPIADKADEKIRTVHIHEFINELLLAHELADAMQLAYPIKPEEFMQLTNRAVPLPIELAELKAQEEEDA